MTIGFCFNVLRNVNKGFSIDQDFDTPQTIKAISSTISGLGHKVIEIEAREDIFTRLIRHKNEIDLVFNIAEGLYGDARESWVPIACEQLQIPYTHSSATVHALKLNKTLAKLAVSGLGIRVPGNRKFPKIIKPNSEGSSIGIFNANVVDNEDQLKKQIIKLRKGGYAGDLITEEYIDGREITVGLLGNGPDVQILPIIEQRFDILPQGMKPIAGYELKWEIEDKLDDPTRAYTCPANLSQKIASEVERNSKKIYLGLGVKDCARIDYRIDRSGNIYFLEINTLPGLNPDPTVISYFPLAARAANIDFSQLLSLIISNACKRYGLDI